VRRLNRREWHKRRLLNCSVGNHRYYHLWYDRENNAAYYVCTSCLKIKMVQLPPPHYNCRLNYVTIMLQQGADGSIGYVV